MRNDRTSCDAGARKVQAIRKKPPPEGLISDDGK